MASNQIPFQGEIHCAIVMVVNKLEEKHGDDLSDEHVEDEYIVQMVMTHYTPNFTPDVRKAVISKLESMDYMVDDMDDDELIPFYVEKILPEFKDDIEELVAETKEDDDEDDDEDEEYDEKDALINKIQCLVELVDRRDAQIKLLEKHNAEQTALAYEFIEKYNKEKELREATEFMLNGK